MSFGVHFQHSITKEEIDTLPIGFFTGTIHVIESPEQVSQLAPLGHEKLIGFDTETRPNFKRGRRNKVALIQLATIDTAYLIRINKIGIPQIVSDVMEDERIVKVGLALKDDLLALQKLTNFEPRGFIDLQQYVKVFSIEDLGLKKLTANILGFRISKRQQTSNWENETLVSEQMKYAATDAWVCCEIYRKLMRQNAEQDKGNT